MTYISSAGIQLITLNNLQTQQNNILTLNQQLASNKKHNNLTDYDPTSAHQLLDLQNSVTQRQSYQSSLTNVNNVLSSYDLAFGDMETINAGAVNIAQQYQSYTPSNQAELQAQTQNYLKQLTDDLNQQVGNRYIFSGARYNTAPVPDLTTVTAAATTVVATSPALPNYDSQFIASSGSDANSYTAATATIDTNYSMTYGVSSNDPSIQKLVNGLRYLSDAANAPDAATYNSAMSNAITLLSASNIGIQGLHTGVAGNQNIVKSEQDLQSSNMSALQDQIGNIQEVDTATIGSQLSMMQTQLQASYSATASLEQLSLVKYL